MTKSELIAHLAAENPHLRQPDIELIVATVFEEITAALARGDRVELRGFGAFSAKQRDARTGRNPRTGAAVPVEGKAVPYFKPGKELRERVNGGRAAAQPAAAPAPRPIREALMLRWILLAPLLILLILFGLSNRQEVYLYLWPFDLAWAAPLSVAILVIGALFFLLGAARHLGRRAGASRPGPQGRGCRPRPLGRAGGIPRRGGPQIGPVPPPAGTNLARLQRPAA